MARYRKVSTQVWNDERVRQLDDPAKLLFLFVLTHPHLTSLGAMRATGPGLAAELGWTAEAFREAFDKVLSKGLLRHDADAAFLWAPKFLKHNGPESPNVVKSWSTALELLPECALRTQLLQGLEGYLDGLGKAFAEAFPEALREALAKGMANQEQEQEQEQQQEIKKTPTASAAEVELSDREAIYRLGKPLLILRGETQSSAGSFLGKLIKDHGEASTAAAVREADRDLPVEPKAYLVAAAARHARGRPTNSGINGTSFPQKNLRAVTIGQQDYEAGLGAAQ